MRRYRRGLEICNERYHVEADCHFHDMQTAKVAASLESLRMMRWGSYLTLGQRLEEFAVVASSAEALDNGQDSFAATAHGVDHAA